MNFAITPSPVRRALLSVSNKAGLIEFAESLRRRNIEILATGGTSQLLTDAKIIHTPIESYTHLPEMFGGRVKTLHPKIHGGILGRRDQDANDAEQFTISWIDLVVVNFYPFREAISQKKLSFAQAMEYIDIGGPTMVRAAAKNNSWVGVVVDPEDYQTIIAELDEQGGLTTATRTSLAKKAFHYTRDYDAHIAAYFNQDANEESKPLFAIDDTTEQSLRYGENPHQKAVAYTIKDTPSGILNAEKLQGKTLSYNNLLDVEAAWQLLCDFEDPTAVIVKHANPCGVASSHDILSAYQKAYSADTRSAFGGIVALNRSCDEETARAITDIFTEVVLAPSYSDRALTIFAKKANCRILQMPPSKRSQWDYKILQGALLVQERDLHTIDETQLQIVTRRKPSSQEMNDLLFAWKIVKHMKSNAILIAANLQTIGLGVGQVSRVDAVQLALSKAANRYKSAVLASDAFFPFRDSIDLLQGRGISAIIQPGGSVRDPEVIDACHEHEITMAFTGIRCFKH